RANGRTAYNNEFDMFTTEMKIELDLNELKPLFWEQPNTDQEPSEDSQLVFFGIDLDWFGYEKYELGENNEDEFVNSMEERFKAFLDQDYHNIKIVVADFTNNDELNDRNIGQRSTGDTALFIDFGTIVTGDDVSSPAGKYHEYLLIENRQQSKPFGAAGPGYEGFEVNMPGNGGLAIWHIDESVQWGNSIAGYPGLGDYPWDGRHHEVALVQADNRFDLEANMNGADAGDLFAAPGNNIFNAFTPQNTDAYKYGCVAKSYASISNISESADIMSFVFMETGVYNDSIARPLSINEFAEFADQGSSSWWVGSGNYTDSWWKYIPPSLSGMTSLNLPARPVNHPRLSANYVPGSYRIYGDTQYAVESWIPNDMDVYRWEYGSPCSGYDWINTPYDAIGDNKKPIDSKGLWYTMTAEKTGFVHMSTCSSGFDTTLAVFAEPNDVYNANKNFFTTNFLACNDDSMVSDPECFYSSELDVYMEKGHEYLIRVGGYNYESGDFDLFINYCDLAANDQPAGAVNLMLNSPVAGNIVNASGTDITTDVNGDMLDLWYMFTPAADGDYRVAACTSVFDSTLAVYMGEVTETGDTLVAFNDDLEEELLLASTGCGPLSSHVSVPMVEGVTYYIRVAGSVDSFGEFTVEVTNRPINDEKANAIAVMDFATYNESYSGSTVNATASLGQDGEIVRTGCNSKDGSVYDVWYVYVPRYDAEVTVSLKESKFDTVLAVYRGDTLLACNDDTYYYSQWSQQSELVTPMEAGRKYYIRVSGWGQDVGNYNLKVIGGEGDGTSALEIVCPDTIELVDASGTGDSFRAGQSVDIRIAAAGGRPDPATGKYRNWSINIPAGDTGNYEFVDSQFASPAGDGLNVNANDSIIAHTLPFGFPFYGTNYTQIGISTNGFIRLDSGVGSLPFNSEQALKDNKVIAPLWDDYKLNAAAFDIFVAQDSDKAVITWVAEFAGDGIAVGDTCKFSATLFKNGSIRFDYGSMLKADGSALTTTPTVGISNGNGNDYHYITSYSFDLNNDNVDDNVRRGLSQAQGIVFTGNQQSPDMLPKGLEAKIDQDGIRISGTIREEYPANEDGAPNFVVEITVSDYDSPTTTVVKQLAMVMIEDFDSAVLDSIMTNWMSAGCADDNWCDKGDLNGDGRVDLRDFAIYALFGADYQ
ncbi:MAG: hypothetical protein JXM68_13550, partial [Sedimentisphaerales bacterium]|nr:hypothetical protein [Sedimentisphaerales bacterium]